jgi:hypothetical protein
MDFFVHSVLAVELTPDFNRHLYREICILFPLNKNSYYKYIQKKKRIHIINHASYHLFSHDSSLVTFVKDSKLLEIME